MHAIWKQSLLACAAVFALLPCTASAQDNESSDRPPQAQMRQQQQRRMAVLAQRLNLTGEQKTKWLQINREANQRVWEARRDDSLNEAQMQSEIRKIHRQQRQQILAMLRPDQQNDLKAFTEEQRQKAHPDRASENTNADEKPDADSAPAQKSANRADQNSDQDDELFAGMAADDSAPPQPAPNSKPPHK